ncbi:RNA-binding cell elongation regulator Jag/EloR [Pectinatus haikarae]|uniref:RNA-binding protein KhpB n=1 Tax=Pectinatus haikarae TaxID=349096 RepID=A0ABT9Y850_9FIRM|nr:RNA-binding cell elongation regulator Jag/EloR [Pectinatus haikarae]MDQ0203324.1 spoIIIJ-associated protein [Pectinatus haikarae]
MAKVIEVLGRDIEEAKRNALRQLEMPESRVLFEILEEPSKGFLGLIGNKGAKIRASVKELLPSEKAQTFLKDVFAAMQMDVSISRKETEFGCLFEMSSNQDMGIMIGKHGQTLDALQYLTNMAANKGADSNREHIILDVEDYRNRREDTLKHLAWRIADKVRNSRRKMTLEPMNRHERKIIHMALQDEADIITYSDGEEPHRRIIVDIKKNR